MKPTRQAIINAAVVATLSTVGGVVVAMAMSGETTPSDTPLVAAPVELVAVPVAATDIPIGTKFTKDNVGDYFVIRQFTRKAVPSNAILDLEELNGQWTTRSIDQGETVHTNDLTAYGSIDPPNGTVVMTIPLTLEPSVRGFALPGYKVTILATKKSEKRQKEIVFPVLEDVLILSANLCIGTGAEQGISIAVPEEKVELLTEALEGGATVRIKLPSCSEVWKARETAREIFLAVPKTSDDVRAALADD